MKFDIEILAEIFFYYKFTNDIHVREMDCGDNYYITINDEYALFIPNEFGNSIVLQGGENNSFHHITLKNRIKRICETMEKYMMLDRINYITMNPEGYYTADRVENLLRNFDNLVSKELKERSKYFIM